MSRKGRRRRGGKVFADMAVLQRGFADAVAHYQRGRLAEAEQGLRTIQKRHPDLPDVLHLLALIALRTEHAGEAVERLERAVQAAPSAPLYDLLGNALQKAGRPVDAIGAYERAVALDPGMADAHYNLGNALKALGRAEDAVPCYRRAASIKPDFTDAHYNLALALKAAGRLDEAAAAYRRVLELNPSDAEALNNLGNVLAVLEKWQDAAVYFRKAIAANPDNPQPYLNYGALLQHLGKVDEAIEMYSRALAIKPDFAEAHSNFLCCSQYKVGVTAARLKELHDEWDKRHGAQPRSSRPPHGNRRDPAKRLRIGFVSPDLGRHPVGFFVLNLLENHRPAETELICYSDRVPDDMTERLRAAADGWHDTREVGNDDLAERIRSDEIDILVDLAGHTADNRLVLFARKPAPVQATWAGYFGTTGLAAIDYLVADSVHVPEGEEHYYSEKIIRMPTDYICYAPPSYAPSVGPLPAAGNGFATFGCFNNIAKINADVLAVWARVLAAVPNSRLVLRSKYIDAPETRQRYLPFLAEQGIEPERLILEGQSPHVDLLARYNDIDVALDPFPYSGGLTTCEAMWMGVPVITWPGRTFAGRHSLAHLSAVGVTEGVVSNPVEYVRRAAEMAGNLAELADLRAGLRKRMRRSPLCDGPGFSRHFTAAMGKAWRQWCARPES